MTNENQTPKRNETVGFILPPALFIFSLIFALVGQTWIFLLTTIPLIAVVYDMLRPQNIKRLLIPKVFLVFMWMCASIVFFIYFYSVN